MRSLLLLLWLVAFFELLVNEDSKNAAGDGRGGDEKINAIVLVQGKNFNIFIRLGLPVNWLLIECHES